ncbi:Ankyrin repeat-containing protein [Artemisia annua]|uniref:Ankyrin repeat-containing protein n=1 Tax=Artemisia annua TaxID=35608 RepID=A0A2U1MSE0_ARTAN|nr:Ankyrin repeat-containing protein [Artemisia annua]
MARAPTHRQPKPQRRRRPWLIDFEFRVKATWHSTSCCSDGRIDQADLTVCEESACIGNVNMAMIMMKKYSSLQYIPNCRYLPLSISALKGKYRTVKYLYDLSQKMTGDPWTDEERELVLVDCVERELFDVALQILNDRPKLTATVSLLEDLAQKPNAFATLEKNIVMRIVDPVISSLLRFFYMKVQPAVEEDTDALKLLKIIWRRVCETMNFNEIEDILKGPPSILFVAAERGNTRFIAEVLRTYPDLMFDENEDGLTIFHIAVMQSHHGIYNLMHEIGAVINDICLAADPMDNYMHHLVGKNSKEMTKLAGASLLMQRELLWFKNKNGQTAYELFSKENEDLVSSGLKWMKDCMVVATLIVTVAFAVAFTVPGGYRQETGFPFFIHDTSFLKADDRSTSTPVAAMMVTFSSSFFVLYNQGLEWVPILMATFAADIKTFTVILEK